MGRSVTLESLYLDAAWEDCREVKIYYQTEPGFKGKGSTKIVLTPEKAGFAEFLTLLKGRNYRLSLLRRLTAWGVPAHTWREGDFWWQVIALFGSGREVMIINFFGKLTIYSGRDVFYVSTDGQKNWIQAVLESILQITN